MEDTIFDKIKEVDLKKTMETSYIDYAMSVIVSRALPDIRDGLKPVQRRILYSMIELNNSPDKPHRKCARIVGDTMGKYHPHGDSSIYGALVNMAQDWSTRYPLVDGHGNFGSVDGDGAAAMRYTEARLTKISMELLADINKDTVDFVPNFDESEKEPTVLPAHYPNLLVNGSSGIAVGMATNIPPHNLGEVIDAILFMIHELIYEDRKVTLDEVMDIIPGPDFPTAGIIMGRAGIHQAYQTGKGKIILRGKAEIENLENGKSKIIITELPYMVNKARLIEKVANLVKEKRIDGITAIEDQSNREGMRVVIDTRRDVNANIILNKLYKHTQLQETFGVNMLALVDNQPKVLNILQMLEYYLKHQEDIITRRTKYDLNKAEERSHILKGLLIALDHIDEVIKIIRNSQNTPLAKENLMVRFDLSEVQSQAIVDMRLRALTGLEREKLENEYEELQKKIAYFKLILSNRKELLKVIYSEIEIIGNKYRDSRRTEIGIDMSNIDNEDLIPRENIIITMTQLGYIKRMNEDTFKSQNRGGKGIKGMQTIDNDYIKDMFMCSTHDDIYMLTSKGRIYKLKGYQIPEASRTSRGIAIINLLQLLPGEKITACIPMSSLEHEGYFFMSTKEGMVKKTELKSFENIRKNGINAISLKDDDELIEVKYTNGKQKIILITQEGKIILFNEEDVRPTGRTSMGVKGIHLSSEDKVVSMQLVNREEDLLFVSENGLGKRTTIDEFHIQKRGGKGIICYKVNEKTGLLIGAKSVIPTSEVLLINTLGVVIRLNVEEISVLGRNTSGVKLMNVDEEKIAGIAKIIETEESKEKKE